MKTYIALLRGINVSGKNSIKMNELQQLFISLGYFDVITYIQSGNVIFKTTQTNPLKLEEQIGTSIQIYYGYTINVLILSKSKLEAILSLNPFLKKEGTDISKLHVTLLNYTPNLSKISQIESLILNTADEFLIDNKCVYLYCPNGYGKTKLTNNLFEKKLNSPATTRNWKTITKLTELSTQ